MKRYSNLVGDKPPTQFKYWAYGPADDGSLEFYVTDQATEESESKEHQEIVLRYAQQRGNALNEDNAWTIDWRYHEGVYTAVWRLGVGGWSLEEAVRQLSKTTGTYEHRIRNMITGEIIPTALFGI